MFISFLGTAALMIVSFVVEDDSELGSDIYGAYLVCGIVGGSGLALFSAGITTVSFWYPRSQQGSKTGIYGGSTNVSPGIFGLWVSNRILSLND